MTNIRFDGRVAAVTGAGNGLGRAHALELARRGAKVVVNDLGVSPLGEGSDSNTAQSVVDEIVAQGGEAVAHFGDVGSATDMQAMVETAINAWGRIDILVSNAGIGSGDAFAPREVWDKSLHVNLHGVVNPLRAAWPYFLEQNYGRVINTASSSMLGTPHAGSYGSAKGGVVGYTKILASTYPDVNVKFNALMPIAWSRMLALIPEGVHRDWMHKHFQPERVSAFVAVLAHESLNVSGEVFTVGGGRAARVLFETTDGWWNEDPSAESFAENFDTVMAGNNPLFANSGSGDLARYVDWFNDPGVYTEEAIQRVRAGRRK